MRTARVKPVAPPALIAVAHGTREKAGMSLVEGLVDLVRARMPHVPVRLGYLQHGGVGLADLLAETGPDAVVVPLLLSRGWHASVDVGRSAARVGARVTPPLGPDPALAEALGDRLEATGAPCDAPVVLVAAGSKAPGAAADVERQSALLARRLGRPVLAAYASAARPDVGNAVRVMSGPDRRPVAVVSYLLAAGAFQRRLDECPAAWISEPLGAHPAVADLVASRYRAALRPRPASTRHTVKSRRTPADSPVGSSV
jgi:sirohydrochlorin ferrochelatase